MRVSQCAPVTERALRGALLFALGLALAHAVAWLWYPGRHALGDSLREVLDLTSEQGLGTWASICAYWTAGIACLLLAPFARGSGLWFAGALFLFLSADDAAMLHERIGALACSTGSRGPFYAWLVVLAPPIAIAGVVALRALLLTVGHRPLARRRLWRGFACLAVALAIEAAEGPLSRTGLAWRGLALTHYTMVFEETLELVGPLLIAAVVIAELEARVAPQDMARAGFESPD